MTSSSSGMMFTSNTTAPVIVADDQGTASPVVNPPLHVNPYDAAKKIRFYVKELKAMLGVGTSSPSVAKVKTQLAEAMNQNNRSKVQVTEAHKLLNNQLPSAMSDLRQAIETRRVSEGRVARMRLEQIVAALNDHDYRLRNTTLRCETYLSTAQMGLEAFEGVPTDLKAKTDNICNELHKLAQSLPTIPNAPMAPADNILRAMASVLKNGGYLDSSSEYVKVQAQPDPDLEKEFEDEHVEVEDEDGEE